MIPVISVVTRSMQQLVRAMTILLWVGTIALPAWGLLDTVEIQVREPVFLQNVFARTLENEIEFWIEAGSCLYDPPDDSL